MSTNHRPKSAHANVHAPAARAHKGAPASHDDSIRNTLLSRPVLAGVCLVGVGVAVTAALLGRSRRRSWDRKAGWLRPPERSFLVDAARQAALALIAIVARRLAENVPLESLGAKSARPLSATD